MHVLAPRCTRTGFPVLFTCLLCASTVFLSAQTQPPPKPFTKDDVLKLLTGNVPAKRVEALVRERGIDFRVTPDTESELRNAGATEPLLAALRDLAPKPPTLVVITTPGGAQVFVDDELIAKTSAEGRLKIPNLKAGSHKLRVSLDGHLDNEQNVELAAGKTVEISPVLEHISSAASSSSVGEAGAGPLHGSGTGKILTFPGGLMYHGGFPNLERTGKLTIGNGKLRFIDISNKDKYSWQTSLSNVVPQNQYQNTVEFDVLLGNKHHYTFFVELGKQTESNNVQAAKDLFEALKAGSKRQH
jgi:hypothetical protein